VPLSDDEQAQLSEIEALILAEDPQFAAHLDLYRAAYRRQALGWLCWWLLVGVGAGLLLFGNSAAQGWISLGTMLAVVGCALILLAAVTACGFRTRRN
jgi:hypothetical protein